MFVCLFRQLIQRTETLEGLLHADPWHAHKDLALHYAAYEEKLRLADKARELSAQIRNATNDVQLRAMLKGLLFASLVLAHTLGAVIQA
jgi:hypothetical protein